jgi:hypothetical protein
VLSPEAMGVPDGHPTTTEVRVELAAVDGRTRMVLTHVGVPSDPQAPPDGRWRSTSSLPTRLPASLDLDQLTGNGGE